MGGFSYEDAMGTPAGVASPGPVAVAPLPNVPGYVSDPAYTPPPGQAGNSAWQAPAVALGGSAPHEFGYDEAAGGGSGPGRTLPVSEVMGLEKGLAEPWQNLWGRVAANPYLKASADSLTAAFPELQVVQDATSRLAPVLMGDVGRRAALGYQPGKIGEFSGNVLTTAGLPGGPMVSGALSGGLLSKSESPLGVAGDMAMGAIGGKVAHSALGAIANVVKPTIAPQVQTLLGEGIPLTMGQIAGGTLRRLEDGATSFPIVGDVIGGAKARSLAGFNRAIPNRALAPIGETLPADVAPGRDAIAYAGDTLSDRYNKLLPTLGIRADDAFRTSMGDLAATAGDLPEDHARMLARFTKQHVFDRFEPDGSMTGENMKKAETAITLKMKRYGASPHPADQEFSDVLGDLRTELRGLVARNNPEKAPELGALNQGWANLAIGEDAASRLGAHEGMVTPGQLAGAVRKSSDTVRKRGYARGEALMQDLSDAALATLPSKVPDSGSPFRHALEAGVAGLVGKEAGMGAAMGKAGALGAILSMPYTPTGQRVMADVLAGARPPVADPVALAIQKLRLLARPVGSQTALAISGPQAQ